MGALLTEAGYEQSTSPDDSDVLIVNTCAFLQAAVDELVGELRTLAEKKREGQVLISAGCMSQRYADRRAQLGSGSGRRALHAHLARNRALHREPHAGQRAGDRAASSHDCAYEHRSIRAIAIHRLRPANIAWAPIAPVQPTAQLKRFRRKAKGPSAYVKISEGCDHKCAFCIIPAISGKHVSRPIDEIAGEIAELAEQGVKEVVLIAQDSTYYGIDLGLRDGLAQLFDAIVERAPEHHVAAADVCLPHPADARP